MPQPRGRRDRRFAANQLVHLTSDVLSFARRFPGHLPPVCCSIASSDAHTWSACVSESIRQRKTRESNTITCQAGGQLLVSGGLMPRTMLPCVEMPRGMGWRLAAPDARQQPHPETRSRSAHGPLGLPGLADAPGRWYGHVWPSLVVHYYFLFSLIINRLFTIIKFIWRWCWAMSGPFRPCWLCHCAGNNCRVWRDEHAAII